LVAKPSTRSTRTRPSLFVVRGRGELGDAHVPGVEGGDEAFDGAAFAGGVPAFEQYAERGADLVVGELAAEEQPEP
jgi:hypothetical protein